MKKMKKKIFYLFISLVILVTSCELPNNIDPKNPSAVPAGSEFMQAHISLVNQLGSINVNTNISRLLAQFQSEVTYVTESRYNFSDRQIPDAYSGNLYNGVLMNLKDCKQKLEALQLAGDLATVRDNQVAILEVLSVYGYQLLVDNFGNVPYTESLLGATNSRPKYDDALTIYKDLVTRIDAAIAKLTAGADFGGFGSYDILYSDDMSLWLKFAASLKLRIGMRLADVTGSNASTIVSQAVATGVFTSQDESAIQTYTGVAPYVNSYYQEFILGNRKDFCPTTTLVNMMNTLNDPRRAIWFTPYPSAGVYTGMQYGKTASSNYSAYSHFTSIPNPKYPVILLDYVGVEFMLAEAAERSFVGAPADAAGHYNNAILASMSYWGVSEADAAAYLAQPTVAYSTATGTYKQKIGTQKWLGLFDQGDEAWFEWRRLDFPILNFPQGMTYADIPKRMPYPFNENKMNKVNYDAAAAAIGGDLASTKLFWDKF